MPIRKANAEWKQQLKSYQAPPLDTEIDEALQAFMAQRKAEIEPEFQINDLKSEPIKKCKLKRWQRTKFFTGMTYRFRCAAGGGAIA